MIFLSTCNPFTAFLSMLGAGKNELLSCHDSVTSTFVLRSGIVQDRHVLISIYIFIMLIVLIVRHIGNDK